MRVEINNNFYLFFFIILSERTFAGTSGGVKQIMPENIELDQLDQLDIVEFRNFSMWVRRELNLHRHNTDMQVEVAGNIDKVTYLPLEEIARRMLK